MTIEELLNFNPETKKNLIRYLRTNKIKYKQKYGQILIYDFELEDFGSVEIQYLIIGGIANSVDVKIKKSSCSIFDLKDKCYEIFGNPVMDNTNHETEEPYICWRKGHLYTSNSNHNKDVYVVGTAFDISQLKTGRGHRYRNFDFSLFLISMLGGFAWGFLFFFFFGLGFKHTPELFVLSMIGGIVFGLLMFLCFGFALLFEGKSAPKPRKIKLERKYIDVLNEYGQINYPEGISTLAMFQTHTYDNINKHTAKIFLCEDGMNVAYIKRKRLVLKSIPYSNIYQIGGAAKFSTLFIIEKDKTFTSLCDIQENLQEIIDFIEDHLGYNSERFLKMERVIFDCIVEYDPASQIALGNDPSVFKDCGTNIAKCLFSQEKLDFETVREVICDRLFDDYYYESFDELACNIFNKLVEEKII